jgi:tetrapyrrole methylase family protein / MazG family protein
VTDRSEKAGEKFSRLVETMALLRGPGGCPWDRKQTFDSIKSYLLEETYEVMEALDQRDWPNLAEELGDLLLQPVFLAEMATEQGLFNIADSLEAINQKLIRRHPHIFGDTQADTAEEVKQRWDEIKQQEKASHGIAKAASILHDVPKNLPALMEAEKISQKAAGCGFEWPDISGVLAKLQEEAAEVVQARASGDQAHVEHEIGDLLFTLVNLARFLKVDPEQALRKSSGRFRKRFAHVEQAVAESGSALTETPLDRMEELWQAAKQAEQA